MTPRRSTNHRCFICWLFSPGFSSQPHFWKGDQTQKIARRSEEESSSALFRWPHASPALSTAVCLFVDQHGQFSRLLRRELSSRCRHCWLGGRERSAARVGRGVLLPQPLVQPHLLVGVSFAFVRETERLALRQRHGGRTDTGRAERASKRPGLLMSGRASDL